MTEPRRRAVIYARLSKDVTKEGAGVARQLEDARKLAHIRGFDIFGEHTDNDTSAAGSKRRPGFDAMLADLEQGRAEVLIAWAWDRLSRNRRDGLRLIEVCQEHRTTIALVRGSDVDMSSASGRLVADLLAGVARAEIDAKSERQKRAELQRAEQGKPPSRRAFGYQRDGAPHPKEAPAVAEVFGLFLAGSTMVGLSKHLNAAGFTSTRGKQWDDTGVRVILKNARYAGERYYRGERVAEGNWAPLVTPETFEAVRARLNDPTKAQKRPARRHLGSSLFLCHCRATVKVSYTADGVRIYKCSAQAHMARKADPVDDVVRAVVAERLRRSDLSDLQSPLDVGPDVAEIRLQAVGYRNRLDGIAKDYADGELTARQLSVATTRIEGQLADIEVKLAQAGKTSALASIAGATDLGDAWLGLPLDRQRAVLSAIADVVILPGKSGRPRVFDADSVRVEWRNA